MEKDVAIIIVNYNVKHFLEQCLISVRNATQHVDAEVIVVDNASLDGSNEMVASKFPEVKLIKSDINLGFSKGNNLGISEANARYILLLNPDTLVEEDTLKKCVSFMDSHEDCGGLGVKMIDGKGRFLPESKRGLPTPEVAFYKMFGLSRLFPKSKRFGKYHLSYLSEDETHEVDVLSGAFMMLRSDVLQKIGLLDETFFMYGEDIDLSYRIQKAGYKNYYFSETSIIHYKGESTKKGSLNYVFIFYKAMIIFARKHFSGSYLGLFTLLIYMAIYARAFVSLVYRLVKSSMLPIFDFSLIVLSFVLVREVYGSLQEIVYDPIKTGWSILTYGLIFVISLIFNGGYDRPVRLRSIIMGTLWGSLIAISLYALLPEELRFSRAVLIIGIPLAFGAILLGRFILHALFPANFHMGVRKKRRFAVVGSPAEASRIMKVLYQTTINPEFVAFISPDDSTANNTDEIRYVGTLRQIYQIVDVYQLHEVIFCAANVESKEIIRYMSQLQDKNVAYKIAPPESLFVIGSNSINTSGELYSILNINDISKTRNKRNKRVVDILASLIILGLSPVLVWFQRQKARFFSDVFNVLFGEKTWVGYSPLGENLHELPAIKKSVLSPVIDIELPIQEIKQVSSKMNVLYAKDYRWWNDIGLILRNWRKL